METGIIGMGRMGSKMAERLRKGGHKVVSYDRSADTPRDVDSLSALIEALPTPRIVWIMVPAGEPTDSMVEQLAGQLEAGDLVIDGGNTCYRDDEGHAKTLVDKGIHFMDCGVSGGVWGSSRGYALMAGGSREDFDMVKPLLETLKPDDENGLVYAGPVGAGHYAKMIHNGIEYGMMQALGEGFATMMRSPYIEDPGKVMTSWRSGSVVASWLLDLLADAFSKDPTLSEMPPVANESGEAKWMVESAMELGVPTPVTGASLQVRQMSRGGADDVLRAVSYMRAEFGGHVTKK